MEFGGHGIGLPDASWAEAAGSVNFPYHRKGITPWRPIKPSSLPNFQKINKEAGQFTSDAISLLWNALNDTRATERRDVRQLNESLAPKVKTIAAAASVNDLDAEGASIVSFTGGTAQNFTGIRAPETGRSRVMFIQVNGAGTITIKNSATSQAGNQFVTNTGADVAKATGTGCVFVYLEGKWRQVS